MAFSVDNWNIAENQEWYVRLEDAGSNMSVKVYASQSDAVAGNSNYAGSATADFGTQEEVTLTIVGTLISLFQEDSTWHLKVSGINGDTAKVFKIAKFTDLPEIRDPIYTNDTLVSSRATAAINQHTHVVMRRQLQLESHYPALEAGDLVRLNSTRRNKTESSQVLEIVTEFRQDTSGEASLTDSLVVHKFIAMKRG